MKKISTLILCILFCILSSASNAAEQKFGDYIVHYNAFAADFLSPEIATQYGITRSRNRAVLNISVQQVTADGKRLPVDAEIEATTINVYQKLRAMDLRAVNDGDAIYQLAEFEITNGESFNFSINVAIANQTLGTITFKQQFFTD